ncbi:MAG: Wzz/FepE/Etk N-terminal domain-containing protein [Chloroflexi bacterium]|nr:Wzz/FepE/Etk N-terminal domain-containing protein [Chloroflexota bacterium]
MELKNYLQIMFRWFWLLVLCALLGIGSGYLASRLQQPTYQASTKILISKDILDQNSQFAAMNNQQLIDAYVQLLTSSSVIDEASRRLNYEINLKELGSVQQVRSTNVIEVMMEDSDPQRVAAIANMLVEVLMDQNVQASGYVATEENIKNKITQLEGQITALQTQYIQISDEKLQSQLKQINDQITIAQAGIVKLTSEIGPLASLIRMSAEQSSLLAEKQAHLAQLQSQLSQYQQIRLSLDLVGKPALNSNDQGSDFRLQQLQSTLDRFQKTYLSLLENLQVVQLAHFRNTPTIDQIEKAIPVAQPVRPQPTIYIILGGIVGLIFALGMIFIIEYLDDTLKTPQDVQKTLGTPVLGFITNMKPASKTEKGLPVEGQLYSQPSDALYALRTNLELAATHSPLKTLLLLNLAEPGKGKTNMAADLAVSFAQSGSRVVLLDADLRNPGVHSYFGLANENGFSDILADSSKILAAGQKIEDLNGMTVITGGNASPVTNGLLRPDKIGPIFEILKPQADLIIIDAPSSSDAASWVLASKVDGVLLAIHSNSTHKASAINSMEQLNLAGANIMGVVLYRIPHDLVYYYRSIRYQRWHSKNFESFRLNFVR